jgi:peptide/nickel transport system substrate-binding protein
MTTSYDSGPTDPRQGHMLRATRRDVLGLAALSLAGAAASPVHAAASAGQLTYGVHISLAPTWFDPAETNGILTPFMLLYAMHDALVKAMPGQLLAPSLAESWSATEDGLNYDFVLREGAKFHNGEPVTADDVKFSFGRYRGTDHAALHQRMATIETPDPHHVRFTLKQPWPDFLTFYGGATGAGWIVPRKYVEQVGDDGFKKAPIGAGPYKFVSFEPGVALLLEAFDQYWRKAPSVKRLLLKVIPDEATRLAALKTGEIDVGYSIRGELADELRHTPGLTLKPVVLQGTFWLYFTEQWNPKSPWYDQRVRQAADLAIDRKGINQALTLGFSRITGSIVPDIFEFYWPPPAPVYDPAKAMKLLADAGFPNGFDAGAYICDSSYGNLAEAVLNNLRQVGIRSRLRPLERASFVSGYSNKSFKGIVQGGSGAFGNAATRMQAFVVKDGSFSYGSYDDIDALYPRQAVELDHGRREALLRKMQELVHDKTMYVPIWQLAFINGIGTRVAESSFGSIAGFAYTAPYEDLTIKNG